MDVEYVNKSRKAFTLIELLVVIAIIALLLSVLIPALQKAKDQTRRMVCQNNVRQQVIACHMYVNDNKDYFPTGSNATESERRWGGQIGHQEVSTSDKFLNVYIGTGRRAEIIMDDSSLKVFRCPADKGYENKWDHKYDRLPTVWEALGRCYRYNTDALESSSGEAKGLHGKKRGAVRNPSRLILVGDIPVTTYYNRYNPWVEPLWHNKKELGWTNVAFVDESIKYLQVSFGDTSGVIQYTYQNGPDWTFLFLK